LTTRSAVPIGRSPLAAKWTVMAASERMLPTGSFLYSHGASHLARSFRPAGPTLPSGDQPATTGRSTSDIPKIRPCSN
jgi:hypothetical protein